MEYGFETLSERHREPVIDIFNGFIVGGFAAYPEEKVDYGFFDRLLEMARGYPAVAATDRDGRVVGFGMLRPYHFASTFRRTAEVSYFLIPECTRQGIGTMMLKMFLAEAKRMGIDTVLASISSRNRESIGFHEKHGFRECGRFRRVGRKFGKDFDVVWMQKFVTWPGA